MASPRARIRLPSWISVDMNDDDDDEVRQPSCSPPKRGGGSPRRHAGGAPVTPYTHRARRSSANTSSSVKRSHKQPSSKATTPAVTPSTPWEERKLSRRSNRGPTVPRESFLVGLCRRQDWSAALLHLQEHPEQAEPMQLFKQEDAAFPLDLHLHNYTRPVPSEEPLVYHESALYVVCSGAQFGTSQNQEDLPRQVLEKLLHSSPKQALVSYLDMGNTCLRALLRNDTCNPKILRLLLEGMKQACHQADEFRGLCFLPDRDGLSPMDHIIMTFHQATSRSAAPLDILKVFVESSGSGDRLLQMDPTLVSPLIRLLTLGNGSSMATRIASPTASMDCTPPLCESSSLPTPKASVRPVPSHCSQQLLEATQYFVHKFPPLLDQTSRTTQCTPLHVALRNYGNFAALIQCFLLEKSSEGIESEDKQNGDDQGSETAISPLILKSLKQENQFGDLPLHVASSVGVPVPILRLVLEGTLQATAVSCRKTEQAVNLCWTVNHAGYTPIDLEWIRHMEDGKGLFMARSFYPLEAGGIKKTFWKQDEFYRVLLQQAVQQAMDVRATNPFLRALHSNNPQRMGSASLPQGLLASSTSTSRAFTARPAPTTRRTPRAGQTPPQQAPFQVTSPPPQPSEQPTWELLLHRIFLITQTAATGQVPKTQMELVDSLLHAACKLCFPVAPSLPLPLLELILFMYPEQLLQPQSSFKEKNDTRNCAQKSTDGIMPPIMYGNQGNLPLHFAVQPQSHLCACQCPLTMVEKLVDPAPAGIDNDATTESRQHTCDEWKIWVKQLMEHGTQACSTTNDAGQLPLHKALEHSCCPRIYQTNKAIHSKHRKKKTRTLSPHEKARIDVVHALVEAFPNSVNVVDPLSQLMPFQMAAASPHMPLDGVFYLLRRSPDAVLA